jgi:hypothetical protein
MSTDTVIQGQAAEDKTKPATTKEFNREEWALQKQAERDSLFERLDETAMRVMRSGEVLNGYLNLAARFPNHSASNQLLIFAAMPEATKVGDFDHWKRLGAKINKDTKSVISILEPGGTYTKSDGTEGQNYNVKKVFDISQTSAVPAIQPQHKLEDLVKALMRDQVVPVELVDELPDEKVAAFDKESNTIKLLSNTAPEPVFKALTIELVQARFAQDNPSYEPSNHIFTSVLACYTLCERYGVDSQNLNFEKITPLLAAFETPKEARALLGEVRASANEISVQVSKNLYKGAQEKAAQVSEVSAPTLQQPDRGER